MDDWGYPVMTKRNPPDQALLAQIVIAFSNGRAAAHAKKMSTLVQWAIAAGIPRVGMKCKGYGQSSFWDDCGYPCGG